VPSRSRCRFRRSRNSAGNRHQKPARGAMMPWAWPSGRRRGRGHGLDAPCGGIMPSPSRNSLMSFTLAANFRGAAASHRASAGRIPSSSRRSRHDSPRWRRSGPTRRPRDWRRPSAARRGCRRRGNESPRSSLAPGNEHVAAVLLQHAERGPMRGAEHRVGHATDEEARGPACAPRRQEPRQPWARFAAAAAAESAAPSGRGSASADHPFGRSISPSCCISRTARAACASGRRRGTTETE